MKIIGKKIRGIFFLVKYVTFAQLYFFVVLVPGTWFWKKELTPYTRRYHQGFLKYMLKAKIKYVNPAMREKIRQSEPGLLLCNHKSWADFTLSILSTAPERAGIVSRAALGLVFPLAFSFACLVEKNLVVFNRGKKNREQMKQQIYTRIKKVLARGISVVLFPEGHRHIGEGTLPLKHGIIRWAYQQKITCSIVLYRHSEKVFNEKKWIFIKGLTVPCLHKGIYRPADFDCEEAFYQKIAEDFKSGYQELVSMPESL